MQTVSRVLETAAHQVAVRPHYSPVHSQPHWDLFKYLGDICHVLSFIILIYNMKKKKNCMGVSYRTQEVYLLVFLIRYSDLLFIKQTSAWDVSFKLAYITMTLYSIYLIRFARPICVSYDSLMDKFPHRKIIIPISFLIGFLLPDYSQYSIAHPFFHKLYNSTVVMESMAILPQLSLLRKIREIEIVTGGYIFCLGIYRGIYLLSWIWRIIEGDNYFWHIYIKFIFGLIQFLLYTDFFINYLKALKERKPFVNLPI